MSDISREIRIVFFGDSICVGQGISVHAGWVTRIAKRMEALSQKLGKELLVVNASVNGNTTRQALERMAYDVQSHGVDIMLVQFGMNDCNFWQTDKGNPRVSEKAFSANLEEMFARGRSFGAQKILLNTNHRSTRTTETMPHTNVTYEQSNQRYNQIIRDLADQHDDVMLTDMEKIFADHINANPQDAQSLVLDDGLHLSLKGHDLYFDAIYPKLEKELTTLFSGKNYESSAA
ncbi:MAG: SGNH/GDSL hydrolase family protein [Rickettsiales bacterium]